MSGLPSGAVENLSSHLGCASVGILWIPEWRGKFKRVAVRLRKALYGHPDAPAFWQAHLEESLTSLLMASVVEGFPSVFWISSLSVSVTIYVDDILAAHRPESLRNVRRLGFRASIVPLPASY